MGKPAARTGDMHTCPKINPGPVPHVGGPVLPGSTNVFINSLPAVRKNDKAICVGPPDTVNQGSTGVFINGKPAARFGDSTAHGGKIVLGSPNVFIGEKWKGDSNPAGGSTSASDGSSSTKSSGNTSASLTPKNQLPKAPSSIAECEQRIAQAKEMLNAAQSRGLPPPASPYTNADKQRIVDEGLNENFIVRVIESKYATDDGVIGNPRSVIRTYWTTTFTQVEHADSDAKLICETVGINYKPDSEYTMLVFDQAAGADTGDMESFIPTYNNLTQFANEQLKEDLEGKAHLLPAVMTPEFSEFFESIHEDAEAQGINLWNDRQFSDYTAEMEPETKELIKIRQGLMWDQLGANSHFLGNGLTKDISRPNDKTPFGTIDHKKNYGIAEVFTYDKNPQTLSKMENEGTLKRLHLYPRKTS